MYLIFGTGSAEYELQTCFLYILPLVTCVSNSPPSALSFFYWLSADGQEFVGSLAHATNNNAHQFQGQKVKGQGHQADYC